MKSLIDLTDVEPLDADSTRALLLCMLNEKEGNDIGPELKDQFLYRVMRKRLEQGSIPVSDWALVVLMMRCINTAQAVMYAHACVEIYRKSRSEVTVDVLCEEFGDGFPTEQATKDFWYSMKVEKGGPMNTDNLLDTREPWVV